MITKTTNLRTTNKKRLQKLFYLVALSSDTGKLFLAEKHSFAGAASMQFAGSNCIDSSNVKATFVLLNYTIV